MVEVFFATNRNPTNKTQGWFGERFHADGPMFFRVGSAQLDKVSNHPDEGYKVKSVSVFPEALGKDGNEVKRLLGSSKLLSDLRKSMMKDKCDVVVLIHGFANTFISSLQRAAQVKQAYLIDPGGGVAHYEPHVVVFSWPSNGRLVPPWEYHSDREDAAASGVAMARFMMRVLDFVSDQSGACNQRIHLVVHSMGNWALRHAVQGAINLLGRGTLPALFTNAFLLAGDEDEDTFEHDTKLKRLTELSRNVQVYHSRTDLALVVSDTTKFNPDRLGSGGPRSFSGLSTRIIGIDCGEVNFTDEKHFNHQYYRLRKEVIDDVRAVLSSRFQPDQVPGRVIVEPGRRFRIPKAPTAPSVPVTP